MNAVCEAASEQGRWKPSDLTSKLRREWVRATAHTHIELTEENRLDCAVELCELLIQSTPILNFTVARRGNWDDQEIQSITTRLGCELQISADALKGI